MHSCLLYAISLLHLRSATLTLVAKDGAQMLNRTFLRKNWKALLQRTNGHRLTTFGLPAGRTCARWEYKQPAGSWLHLWLLDLATSGLREVFTGCTKCRLNCTHPQAFAWSLGTDCSLLSKLKSRQKPDEQKKSLFRCRTCQPLGGGG